MKFVKNVPNYAYNHKYWVCTNVNHTLWFFGAWDTEEEAYEVAEAEGENKVVITNEEVR